MPTTFELLVLSSSPPPSESSPRLAAPPTPPNGQQQRATMAAYSPVRHGEERKAIRSGNGALKSGSRAPAIPETALRGFATAGELVRSHHFGVGLDEGIEGGTRGETLDMPEERGAVEKQPRKRTVKTKDSAPAAVKARRPRVSKLKITTPAADAAAPKTDTAPTSEYFANATTEPPEAYLPERTDSTSAVPIKKPRKPRAKKDVPPGQVEAEPKPKKSRIRKPRVVTDAANKGRRKGTGAVSTHFKDSEPKGVITRQMEVQDSEDEAELILDMPVSPKPAERRPQKRRPPNKQPEPLELEEAVARRRDWTPPPDTGDQLTPLDFVSDHPVLATEETARKPFLDALKSFAYAQPEPQLVPVCEPPPNEGAMRKRRIDMVNLPTNQPINQPNCRNPSPDKGKAPKKKPRTITDLVTGQYAPKDAEPLPSNSTNTFFALQSASTKVPLNDISTSAAANPSANPARKRSLPKSSEKCNKISKSSAKVVPKPKMLAEKLLSPASAMSRLNRQDVLFGTSSQLALEESPTMIRQLQQAMRQSEEDASLPPGLLMASGVKPAHPSRQLAKVEGRQRLWAASSRDADGKLLDRQQSVYLPEPDRTQDIPLLMDGTIDDPDVSFADIDEFPQAVQILSDLPTPPETIPDEPLKDGRPHNMHEQSFEDIDDFLCQIPPSGQQAQSSFLDIDDFSPKQPVVNTPPPDVVSTGSPKKRSGRPPKATSAIPPRLQKTASAPPKLPSPKKCRPNAGAPNPTPRSSRFVDIEEILDSENDEALSPTPPRLSRLPDSAPLPFDCPRQDSCTQQDGLIPIYKVQVSQLAWAGVKEYVFQEITAAIRGLPPTADPKKPCWHEKILMYDPIVLEDLTAYLNSSSPIRTWRRATQKQIKAWNRHLKGVGEKILEVEGRQEDPEEVLVVKKELEAWAVQAWCQEMSVCCIYREGRGKGGVRQGLY